MTRKRFIKRMMASGVSRNNARRCADGVPIACRYPADGAPMKRRWPTEVVRYSSYDRAYHGWEAATLRLYASTRRITSTVALFGITMEEANKAFRLLTQAMVEAPSQAMPFETR